MTKDERKKLDAYGRVKNIAPGRSVATELQRIALLLRAQSGMGVYDEDANMLDELAETLLDIRQAVRGGSREKQVRNWHEDG
jgi:hypothetical protein